MENKQSNSKKREFAVKEIFPTTGCAPNLKGFYNAVVEIIYYAWQQEKNQAVDREKI